MSLFANTELSSADRAPRPLADRMRPRTLDEFVGQQHILGPGRPLRVQIERDEISSLILWGPPGVGKTTLAHLIANRSRGYFVPFSAVMSGIKEVRTVMEEAAMAHRSGTRTILFIDEIHRFNKAQQDAFLPHVEKGDIILIGATTENPSFEVISALLSRSRVYHLFPLELDEIVPLLERAIADRERGLGHLDIQIAPELVRQIAAHSNGDARMALNLLENVIAGIQPEADGQIIVTAELLQAALQRKTLLYDKSGEEHFNLISALHKSMRNSDPDASIYWLVRMLEAGEDPLYIARRLVRFASEDVGLADPRALQVCVAAMQAVDLIGMPEGGLALAEAAVYLSLAPRSNSIYAAYEQARDDVQNRPAEPVPFHLRNAPTKLMKQEGYGAGYQYAHDVEGKIASMPCLPEGLAGRKYWHPGDEGWERELRKRLEEIFARRQRID